MVRGRSHAPPYATRRLSNSIKTAVNSPRIAPAQLIIPRTSAKTGVRGTHRGASLVPPAIGASPAEARSRLRETVDLLGGRDGSWRSRLGTRQVAHPLV
jgi:hypothetical protein